MATEEGQARTEKVTVLRSSFLCLPLASVPRKNYAGYVLFALGERALVCVLAITFIATAEDYEGGRIVEFLISRLTTQASNARVYGRRPTVIQSRGVRALRFQRTANL